MMHRRLLPLAAIAAIASLAACNSGNNPGPVPTLGPTCQLPSGVQTALVYPAPNSTVSASSVTQLIIGSTAALDSSRFQIVITDAVFPYPIFKQPGGSLASVSPPFPSPNATPAFANPQYQSSTLNAQFAASQVVTVYINDSKSGDNCTPLSLGQFTTQ
jgi:hypothetical protein